MVAEAGAHLNPATIPPCARQRCVLAIEQGRQERRPNHGQSLGERRTAMNYKKMTIPVTVLWGVDADSRQEADAVAHLAVG
jgi:hypothetical protein